MKPFLWGKNGSYLLLATSIGDFIVGLQNMKGIRPSWHVHLSNEQKGAPWFCICFFWGWITTQLLVRIISSVMTFSGSLLYKQPVVHGASLRPVLFQPGSICFNTGLLGVRTHELTKCGDWTLIWGAYRQATYAAWLDFFVGHKHRCFFC